MKLQNYNHLTFLWKQKLLLLQTTCAQMCWSPSVHRYTYIYIYSSPSISYNGFSGSMHTCTSFGKYTQLSDACSMYQCHLTPPATAELQSSITAHSQRRSIVYSVWGSLAALCGDYQLVYFLKHLSVSPEVVSLFCFSNAILMTTCFFLVRGLPCIQQLRKTKLTRWSALLIKELISTSKIMVV